MNKLKVIQVLPELESGGVERGTLELGRFLASQGHESVVVSGGGPLVAQLEEEGSRHVNWPLGEKSLRTLRYVRPFRRFLEKERPHILHLRSRCPAWVAWLAWRGMDVMTRPRLVTTVHGFNSVNRYSKIMTCGERVIVVSESVKDYVRKNYPDVPDERLRVVHRGVDPAEYPYGYRPSSHWLKAWREQYPELEGRYVLALPGRITRLKGQEDLFRIVRSLRERDIPAHGLVIGGAHSKKTAFATELRKKVVELGVENAVTFTGVRSDMREILAASDVVLSIKTEPEAFGRTTLEALCLGRPVIGYNYGGVGEQLARLFPEGAVPPRDVEAVVELLESWADQPPHPVNEPIFTLDAMLRGTFAIYEELIADKRPIR